jgi:hypothetical protein
MPFEIRVCKSLYATCVYVNDLLHLQIKHEDYRFLYSYVEGEGSGRRWFIEFYYKGMESIVIEYDSMEKWNAVLKELSKVLV